MIAIVAVVIIALIAMAASRRLLTTIVANAIIGRSMKETAMHRCLVGAINSLGVHTGAARERGSRNDISFHMLHAKDKGRIHNERVCDVCHKRVEWEDLVKGYEFDDGRYVVLDDKDFEAAAPELTKSIDIEQFVDLADVDPRFFDTPYYLEPEKKGGHAYAVLRDVLQKTKKVGIARVVLRSREHLAALKPVGNALTLELMHFADELVPPEDVDVPARTATTAGEIRGPHAIGTR